MADIARALDRNPGVVWGFLRNQGGIAPRERSRNRRSLSGAEREEISRGIAKQNSVRQIAKQLGRAPSTISREVRRNGGTRAYRATVADVRAWQAATRPKQCKLSREHRLRRLVAKRLAQNWSPAQISGWLRLAFPETPSMTVSHETIYRTLFVQARGALKKELVAHLRCQRGMRRSRHATASGQSRGQIRDAVSISERPAEAEDRAVPGHWEGDLLSGSANTHIATLVERASRFTMLVKLEGKDTVSVTRALKKQIRKLPATLRRSLTWDRGGEMGNHAEFTVATGVKVYFCDPQSPWQRGTNENTNRLLRQYFPRRSRLDGYTQAQLNAVARELNGRPRKTLNFSTPTETLNEALR